MEKLDLSSAIPLTLPRPQAIWPEVLCCRRPYFSVVLWGVYAVRSGICIVDIYHCIKVLHLQSFNDLSVACRHQCFWFFFCSLVSDNHCCSQPSHFGCITGPAARRGGSNIRYRNLASTLLALGHWHHLNICLKTHLGPDICISLMPPMI